MLFEQRFWGGLADGSITMTFRRWKRRQVVAGNRYRTPAGILQVDAADVIAESAVTDADASRAGYPSASALVADLRGTADLPLYRIRFHRVDGPDPRDVLANAAELSSDDRAEIDRRLARLDRASSHGPWTAAVLDAIAKRPGVRAADVADGLGRDLPALKLDVRKLKNLGLTVSLKTGYRLSPRGESYLRQRAHSDLSSSISSRSGMS